MKEFVRFALAAFLFAPLFAGAAIDIENFAHKPDGFARGVVLTVDERNDSRVLVFGHQLPGKGERRHLLRGGGWYAARL